jgi:hypothetical protein
LQTPQWCPLYIEQILWVLFATAHIHTFQFNSSKEEEKKSEKFSFAFRKLSFIFLISFVLLYISTKVKRWGDFLHHQHFESSIIHQKVEVLQPKKSGFAINFAATYLLMCSFAISSRRMKKKKKTITVFKEFIFICKIMNSEEWNLRFCFIKFPSLSYFVVSNKFGMQSKQSQKVAIIGSCKHNLDLKQIEEPNVSNMESKEVFLFLDYMYSLFHEIAN